MVPIDLKNKNNNKKINLPINDYKEQLFDKKSIEKNIINDLRNDLLKINLNEDE